MTVTTAAASGGGRTTISGVIGRGGAVVKASVETGGYVDGGRSGTAGVDALVLLMGRTACLTGDEKVDDGCDGVFSDERYRSRS